MKKLLLVKAIFLVAVLLIVWLCTACGFTPVYTEKEVKVFLATGNAVQLKDSVDVFNSHAVFGGFSKLPIITIDDIGYYPMYYMDGKLYYQPAVLKDVN